MGNGHQSQPGSVPGTPSSPQPVVRPSEAIFVEWSPKTFLEYFDGVSSTYASSYGSVLETIVDPQIEVEAEKKRNRKNVNLEDCLDEFSKEETLGQDDLWYCPVVSIFAPSRTLCIDPYTSPFPRNDRFVISGS